MLRLRPRGRNGTSREFICGSRTWGGLQSVGQRTGTDLGPNRSGRFAVRSVQHHGSRVGCMVYRQFEASGSLRRGKWHRNVSRLPNKMKIFRVRDERKKKDKNKHRAQKQQSSDNPPSISLSLSNSLRRDTVFACPLLFTKTLPSHRLAKDSRATLDGLHGRGFWGYFDSLRAAD